MENVNKSLDDLIQYIIHTKEYEECITLQNQMSHNEEVMNLIREVKDLQRKYIRSNYDCKIKEELDSTNQKLMDIPIYYMYNNSLEKVNEMIQYVKESLNDYFDHLLNEKN